MINLDHPNIARLFEVYDYKSHYVLILELCEGGELFKKIKYFFERNFPKFFCHFSNKKTVAIEIDTIGSYGTKIKTVLDGPVVHTR